MKRTCALTPEWQLKSIEIAEQPSLMSVLGQNILWHFEITFLVQLVLSDTNYKVLWTLMVPAKKRRVGRV